MARAFMIVPGFAIAFAVSVTGQVVAQQSSAPAETEAVAPAVEVPVAATEAPVAATEAPAAAQEAEAELIVTAAASDAWDPLQDLNRATHKFNVALSTVVVETVVGAYRSTVPDGVQAGVDNLFTNLREPLTILSSGLQGDLENAGISAGRFVVNTTVGIGGLFDVATTMGWVSRPEDLGTTLCTYGVDAGPYLVLPFLGPSTGRDAVGLLTTYALTANVAEDLAVNYIVTDRTVAVLSDSEFSESEASDPYQAERDAYLAFREQICADEIPADQLKASPLGAVKKARG